MGIDVYQAFSQVIRVLESELKEAPQVANTREFTNVFYMVTQPRLTDLSPHQPWADVEFEERVDTYPHNPGKAWAQLPEVWEPMKEKDGRYSYTYSERMCFHLREVLAELRNNPLTREAFLAVWDPSLDVFFLSKRRVPCTIGYLFQIRDSKLHMTYLQRSCNFLKHFHDDCYLAVRLQQWVAEKLGVPMGSFTHWIGSLHTFIT